MSTPRRRAWRSQLGRQSFEDRRQWLYDADLDAARGYYRAAGLTLEVSASREALVDQDVLNPYREESIDNYILHATYGLGEGLAAGGYGILRDPGGAMRRSSSACSPSARSTSA